MPKQNKQPSKSGNFFTLLLVAWAGVIGAFLSYFGAQTSNLPLIITGVLPALIQISGLTLLIGAILFIQDSEVLISHATFYQEVWALVIGILLPPVFGFISAFKFSFYSATSQGFLSSIASSTSPTVQAIIDVILAPIQENFFIFSMSFAFYEYMVHVLNYPRWKAAIYATIPGAGSFMGIHGAAEPQFYIQALVLAFIMFAPALLESVSNREVIPYIALGFPFGVGLHMGINLSNLGGFWYFMDLLGRAQGDVVIVVWLIYIFIAFIVIYLAAKTVDIYTDIPVPFVGGGD